VLGCTAALREILDRKQIHVLSKMCPVVHRRMRSKVEPMKDVDA